MKTRIGILVLVLAVAWVHPAYGEDAEHRKLNPHSVSIGWGDQHFEHLIWHETAKPTNVLPDTYSASYMENMRYTQHWFVEYQYRHNGWFSYGGMLDGSGVLWDNVKRNGAGTELSRDKNRSLYNIVLMPTIQFTYLHHPYVSLHSGLGIGLDINGGTELDSFGRKTVCAPAINLNLIGLSAMYRSWFATVDFGALIALTGGQSIYLLGSRLFSVSVGYTF